MVEDKGCLARYCNGPKECEEDWCEAEEWCKFHPKFKKEEDNENIDNGRVRIPGPSYNPETDWP